VSIRCPWQSDVIVREAPPSSVLPIPTSSSSRNLPSLSCCSRLSAILYPTSHRFPKMSYRGQESPMDFQWENTSGRMDPNSPFATTGIKRTAVSTERDNGRTAASNHHVPETPVKKSESSSCASSVHSTLTDASQQTHRFSRRRQPSSQPSFQLQPK
jgi:hypothetical protein